MHLCEERPLVIVVSGILRCESEIKEISQYSKRYLIISKKNHELMFEDLLMYRKSFENIGFEDSKNIWRIRYG